MLFAALVIGSQQWLWSAIAFCAVLFLLMAWSYVRSVTDGWIKATASLLKALGILALVACLVEPLWSSTRPRPGSNLFALLCDNSKSLTIHDKGETKARGEDVKRILSDEKAPWSIRLNQDFEVRRYVFDSRVESTRNFAELKFDGDGSALALALHTLRDRYEGRPLAGLLVFSDGNATDLNDGALDTAGLPPVYPVILGGDEPAADLAISAVSVTQTSFEDAPVTLQADVAAAGYAGKIIVAQLLDEQGEKVAEQTAKVLADDRDTALRFQFRPKKPGVSFFRLQVAAQGETTQFNDATESKEATTANNRRLVAIDRGQGPYRVLYVSGRPNWEFKFLRRAVEEDEQVQLVALIRIARREAKFEFLGRRGESTNPLFRGFDNTGDDTESYDKPVIMRLGIKEGDDSELRDGFPKTEELLYPYHAIILDDVESAFFTQEQMNLLSRYVSERGGGLLMLGGQESFQKGNYHRTPVGEMLPVYLDRMVKAPIQSAYRLSLSREGWLQPWVRLRANEADEERRLSAMPAFRTLNRVQGIKPGASVLAQVSDPAGTSFPALVAQRFGAGRTAAMLVGDAWRWQLRQESGEDDLEKSWRQLVRWLVADVPQRVSMEAVADPLSPQHAVKLNVRVRDEKFKPQDNAVVSISVGRTSGLPDSEAGQPKANPSNDSDTLLLNAEPAAAEAGLYQAVFVPREPGAYRAEATVTDDIGVEVGKSPAGWSSDPASDEFRTLRPNRELLEKLAADTGGEVVELDELESFARGLSSRKMPITEPTLFPLWDQWYVFCFALSCLVGEWGLRRWRGLA